MLYVDWLSVILVVNFILVVAAIGVVMCNVKAWKIYVPMFIVFLIVFIGLFRVDTRLWCVEQDLNKTKQDIEYAKQYCVHSHSDEDMLKCRIMLKNYAHQQIKLEERKQWYLIQKFAD